VSPGTWPACALGTGGDSDTPSSSVCQTPGCHVVGGRQYEVYWTDAANPATGGITIRFAHAPLTMPGATGCPTLNDRGGATQVRTAYLKINCDGAAPDTDAARAATTYVSVTESPNCV
jgi:hypothetical protein